MGKLKKRYKVPPIFQGKNIGPEELGTIDPETGEEMDFYKLFSFDSLSEKDKALLILRRYKRIHGGLLSRQSYYPNCSGLIKKLKGSPGPRMPVLSGDERSFIREAEGEVEGECCLPRPWVTIDGKSFDIKNLQQFVTWREASFLDSNPAPLEDNVIPSSKVEDVAYKINGKWYNRWGEVE